ncbi:STAS-like domain-containing protein [Shewanella yunxiaonensis]|uniref:STAS-like domain-containing protein n=1 Tax=Shewanella yunxiaonensis TaxID=2829809 RepID=A0ABX7YRJ1_9GAMM|nr:STAS-like domain-containing protein [Shewanella yunxiaonensis]QUN05352.1 STAS-like domain-containing protein [Shewanella yunxiaonensis]
MDKILIGMNFSSDPSGRYYTDGDGSGEEFREEVLKPLLEKKDKIEIDIEKNVDGYGSSFLVEAFGGLIKHGYFTSDEVLSKIVTTCKTDDYKFYQNKIEQYIKQALYNSEKYVSTKDLAIKQGVFKSIIDKKFVADILKD